jgi:hypothetical protein
MGYQSGVLVVGMRRQIQYALYLLRSRPGSHEGCQE